MTTAVVKVKDPIIGSDIPLKRTGLEWAYQLRQKFKAAISHTYIITGNVRDMVDDRSTLNTYLSSMFLSKINGKRNFDLVIFYDRASGLRFPTPAMEEIFIQAAGLGSKAPTQATTGVFGAAKKNEVAIPKTPALALDLIEKVLRDERKDEDGRVMHTVVIIDYAESLFPAGTWAQLTNEDRDRIVKLATWSKDPELSLANNPIFLIADAATNLHDTLTASSSRIEQLEILLPTPEERLSFIEYLEAQSQKYGKGSLQYAEGYDARQFAHQTAGLRKISIEDIKMATEYTKTPISAEVVKERKREIFTSEYQSVIEMVDPEHGFEAVGGFEWLKEFFRQDVIKPMLAGDLRRCPMGVLFAGASGTGKTVLAEAIAYEAGVNMVKLDIGKMLGSLVGQSEAACRKALMAIRSLFPVLVFLDEADQAVNRGSHGDSGVSERIFKMLLEFMSDTRNRGKVFFILATNRVDNLDPALKRPGRIDKIIPFLPPDPAQRKEIFPAVFLRYKYEVDGKLDLSKLAIDTDGWVGSDIEGAIVKAYTIACRAGRDKITQADIEQAVQAIIPPAQTVQHWTNLALLECNDTDLLPPAYRKEFAKKRKDIERDVERANRRGIVTDAPRRLREDIM